MFNLLTKESAEASDALFVTLDPLVRQVSLPDKRQLLVSDTVGFIDRLPHTLVAAFRATLEQVAEADLVLHVIDAASPERDRHMDAVRRVLEDVGAATVTTLDVFNKCDLIEPAEADRLAAIAPGRVVHLGAPGKSGRDDVDHVIAEKLEMDTRRVMLEFDSESEEDRERIARVYRHARVVSHVTNGGRVAIEADVPQTCPRACESGRCQVKRAACLLLATVLIASCARTVAPPVVTTPRYPDYIFPTLSPPDPKQNELLRQHDGGWRWFQAGDFARADREFQAVLKRSPQFYPTVTALGTWTSPRSNHASALERFDRVLAVARRIRSRSRRPRRNAAGAVARG